MTLAVRQLRAENMPSAAREKQGDCVVEQDGSDDMSTQEFVGIVRMVAGGAIIASLGFNTLAHFLGIDAGLTGDVGAPLAGAILVGVLLALNILA